MCKNLSNVLSGQTGSHSPARIDDYSRYFTALSHDQNVCFILVNYYSVSLSLPLSGNSMTANKKSKKIEAKQHANTKSANQSKSSSEICHIRIIQLMSLVRFRFCLDFCLFSNISIKVRRVLEFNTILMICKKSSDAIGRLIEIYTKHD